MTQKPKRRSWTLRLLVLLIIVLAAFFLWQHFHAPTSDSFAAKGGVQPRAGANSGGHGGAGKGRRGNMLSPVQVAPVVQQDVPRYLSGLGTVSASKTATITSQVSGQLMAIHFTDGQQVRQGDLLAEIDPRPYQVQLTQALGQLAKDRATLLNAKADLTRYQNLLKTNLVSRQQVDTQLALVEQSEGAVKTDQGAVDSAQLQILYSRITAPFAGRIGLSQIDPGNYIATGTTPIVILTQTHPIDVQFTLPEGTITDLQNAQKRGPVTVEAWDRTNQHLISQGLFVTLDNQIDTSTGTIRVKSTFDNQDDTLFPNQFVNARLKVETLKNALVIPTAALQMGNAGHFVWTVDDDDKVSRQSVIPGLQDSQRVVITSGLTLGQRVVTDGIDQLTEGTKVDIVTPDDVTGGAAKPVTNAAQAHSHHQRNHQEKS